MPPTDPYAQRRAWLQTLRDEAALALATETDPARTKQLRRRLEELEGVLDRLNTHLREPTPSDPQPTALLIHDVADGPDTGPVPVDRSARHWTGTALARPHGRGSSGPWTTARRRSG